MPRAASVLLALALLLAPAAAGSATIESIAGGGPDNLPALEAPISNPESVVVDANGNLFIASEVGQRLFKVGASGQLTVVAGKGVPGFGGDGGPATEASVSPAGVATDASGNLFIADRPNNRVRKVDTAGIITTVAGNGTFGSSGDGGPATAASLRFPTAVAVDANGSLYITEASGHRVRKVDTAGVITTVAGTGIEGFSGDGGLATAARLAFPTGVAVDANGNVFIAATSNQRIRKVDATTGVITTVAGNGMFGFSGDAGPATSARLNAPRGVAIDGIGNVFIADANNHRIRKVNTAGVITTVAGTGIEGFAGDGGPAAAARLNHPQGVTVDASGTLFIADVSNRRVRKVDAAGTITTVAGNGTDGFGGDGGPATSASLRFPSGVAAAGAGDVLIADRDNRRIRKVDAAGTITTLAGNGVFGFSGDGGPATSASLANPSGVAAAANGDVYITDQSNHRIRKVDGAGTITTVAGTGIFGFSGDAGQATSARLRSPSGVAVDDGNGDLFIADQGNQRIRKVNRATGIITTVAGTGISGFGGDGGAAISASLRAPSGVAVDTSGNLYIADRDNNRIRKVDAAGIITTVAGTGVDGFSGDGDPATSARLRFPSGVAVDANGNVFIADDNNHRVRKVDTAGIITTVAGTGVFGFGGDGGPAADARLANPSGVAVDGNGDLLIADQFNQRIRRVVLNEPPVAVAGPDQTLIVGESGRFDGSASFDTDGVIVQFAWTFGDSGVADGAVANHAYAAAGEHTVTLTVTDDQGASGSDSAVVTVITPAQAIELLAALVESFDLHHGIARSLDATLQTALAALNAANAGLRRDARNKLQAVVHEVEAQRGKTISSARADELLAWANRIIGVL